MPVSPPERSRRPTRSERVAAKRRRRARILSVLAVAAIAGLGFVIVSAASRTDSADRIRADDASDGTLPRGDDPTEQDPTEQNPTDQTGPAGGPTVSLIPGAPVPVPAEGVYFGTWRGPGPDRTTDPEANIEDAESDIGRTYAIERRFYRWGTPLPTAHDEWTARQGRIPMISLRSRDNETAEYIPWAEIANGDHDGYLNATAENFADWGQPVFFIFDAEADSQVPESGDPEDFRAAWRHVVGAFEFAGATNVSFMWTTTSYSFRPESERTDVVEALYPGDDVVDWIAADPYNFFEDGDWVPLGDEIAPWYEWARANHPSKPLAFSEWGSKEDGDDDTRKAQWLREALDTLRTSYPEVRAVVYFDERKEERNTVNDWRIDTSQASLDAFAEIGADAYFAPMLAKA